MWKSQLVSVFRNQHDCDLKRGSESYLPGLPTHSIIFAKWWRKIKRYMILSSTHRKSKRVFRSHFAIMSERLRHSKNGNIFIIHPLSLFAIYREHFVCILLILVFIIEPFLVGFYLTMGHHPFLFNVKDFIDLCLFINIIFEFFTGYCIPLTREIILAPKKICTHYLKTYFFIDFVSCIPYHHLTLSAGLDLPTYMRSSMNLIKFVRVLRLNTMSTFTSDLFLQFGMTESRIKWVKIFLMTLCIIHLWTCVFHGLPIVWYSGHQHLPETSWLMKAHLFDNGDDINHFYNYMICLLTATTHFLGASEGDHYFNESFERVMASLCLMSGFAYGNYFVAHFLQIFGAINIADSKYDELVYQLEEYSRSRKLPEELQQRLKTYYEYKFQKRFFKEQEILNTLSEHLRYEILLYNCRHIVEKVMALKGLSKSVVGGLIANFKLEIYLQNDVIIKHGDLPMKMYFISHGTVAVYCSNGQEITHHEDGDFFGSIQDVSLVSIIAAEITETFSMDINDAKYIFKLDKEVADRLTQLQADKQTEYQVLADNIERIDHDSVLARLRQGYILEKRRRR